MSDGDDVARRARESLGFSRWWLVVAAALGMAVVSPYQYVWSSIQGPLERSLAIEPAALGTVFTLFVVFQAGSQFPVGWWRDRHGPRGITLLAAVLAGGGYLGLAYATEVWQIYVLYSAGAVGVGIVYTVAVNTALKWFPDRRGLTTGIGTMAFAGGSVLFVPYVRANATVEGFPTVLLTMGAIIAVAILLAGLFLRDPPNGWLSTDGIDDGAAASDGGGDVERQFSSREVLRTWQFWLMYAMFVAVSGAGLMLTAKVIGFAQSLSLTATTATISATVLPLAGGVGRLVMGEVSDRVERERAMAASFVLCGLGLLAVVHFGRTDNALGFILAVVVATFFWSPQYTLFPSVVGDYYGRTHSSANYALLYSGKVWGGVFGGTVTAVLVTAFGWSETFVLGGVLAVLAGVAALALRPPS
jgi:OFA family oxalate/formate antiporter-like MFS transporter